MSEIQPIINVDYLTTRCELPQSRKSEERFDVPDAIKTLLIYVCADCMLNKYDVTVNGIRSVFIYTHMYWGN